MNIDYLRTTQQTGVSDLLSTLKTVEINPVDICNRSCSFCPRSDFDLYPNTKEKMSLNLVSKIAMDLKDINYNSRVSFVGFGEPLLYKSLVDAVRIVSSIVPLCKWIEINTNADFLTRQLAEELSLSGCTNITVSMYDTDISDELTDMLEGIDIEITFKHCYQENFELSIVNRNDILVQKEILNYRKQCYLPFYKMFIDWNGDMLVCCNDWGRKGIVGNVSTSTIKELWLSEEMNTYRRSLEDGDRARQDPCKYCNISGTKHGKDSFDFFKDRYLKTVS
jgi:radical SAM protein with 4Fe4S-binding SPASM domain